MLKKIFDLESPWMLFLSRVADLLVVNVLFILGCLPIVTIGASFTGLYYVTLKMIRQEEGSVSKTFWKGFRENIKQATIVWLILALLGGLLYADYRAIGILGKELGSPFRYGWYMLCLLYGFVFAYVFPILATFENTVKNTMKNALLMSLSHLPDTVAVLLIWASPFVLFSRWTVFQSVLTPVFVLVGFGLLAYFSSWFLMRVFRKFMPEECLEKEEEE